MLCLVLYTLKTVKFLILRKGGKLASIFTYRPMGTITASWMDVPYIKALEFRQNARRILPFKVKNKTLRYTYAGYE